MVNQVRLYSKGGTPTENIIEDLELVAVPAVDDTICLEYDRDTKTVYRVLSRRFYVLCTQTDTKNKFDRIALEVEEV
ncbi:hypothetical protein [uncultured Sulfitobacter sp.]|uniref:hypothetical protein n=1 Tax=uncultured Sulfitobacter sp. TaxID=191468 RepID=UPI0030D93AFE|tara:strand:+ start:1329 stop:1559 length:231 start_codon:yes stop_codon:yes gene_type:complete